MNFPNINDKEILRIALPAIAANITVPLLGLVDVAITGHLGNAAYIGAIAVGSMIFNVVYWVFGFLRMGTSGMASQAYGRGDTAEALNLLARGLCAGLTVAAIPAIALTTFVCCYVTTKLISLLPHSKWVIG